MNSSSKTDILKWHPQEYTSFENRCTIYYLGTPLNEIFSNQEISELAQCGAEFLYMLSFYIHSFIHLLYRHNVYRNYIKENNNNEINVLDKFKDYKFI